MAIEREEIERLAKDRDDELAILERSFSARLKDLLANQTIVSGPKQVSVGSRVTQAILNEFSARQLAQISVKNDKVMENVEALRKQFSESEKRLQDRFDNKVEKLQGGDELPPGVMKMVKVFVAVKRKLQPGDKMAGRHGNKGVISKIAPLEDMPHLEDGTIVDIVLNPLGVPSRMNVGQILETHLGWASAGLGRKIGNMLDKAVREGKISQLQGELKDIYGKETFDADINALDENQVIELAENLRPGVPMATPVFDGAHEEDIVELLQQAGLQTSRLGKMFYGTSS